MSEMSDYLELELLDHVFGCGTLNYTSPTTVYVALCTAAPNDASTGSTITEANYTGYARKSTVAADWSVAAARGVNNANAITFAQCTLGSSSVTHMALVDDPAAGNVLFYTALAATLEVTAGITPEFEATNITVTFDADTNLGGISDYLAHELLDHVFGMTARNYTPAVNLYLDLLENDITAFSSAWDRSDVTECTYTSYDNIDTDETDWDVAAAGVVDNTAELAFPACTGGTSTAKSFALFDAQGGVDDNLLFFGGLDADLAISTGITPKFAAGVCDITMT